ncbi:K(+)-transporting ATPase subunit C [Staphylococcus lutrae]|uniref:Potassium-transporting ATPase KdpC subunit n=1 Tax=Staphylococcus lutrae TaxID=155085 RepID=A0AAC9RU54_9STAP|nr:K(+)-transporting ATPase subunit C [Staphylococcus lutrae]ARJ50862.1 potassium-transporting ATPase subunit C [Staphylococcus lutrae]PNZ39849.1 K(+)-transporting ATPase subunit C [Staphylococcus lutrae]
MQTIRKSFGLLLIMFVLCGLIFPLAVTAAGQILFHDQANGSLLKVGDKVVGSKQIGQQWTDPKYFHGRISAVNYNMNAEEIKENGGPASGGSNYSNTNPSLEKRVQDTIKENGTTLSNNAVTASGSGLDPDITVTNAKQQVNRIAKERHIPAARINRLIEQNKQSSPLTEDYVNVLEMNLSLDKL